MVKMNTIDTIPSPHAMQESVDASESSDFIIYSNPPSPVSNAGSNFLMNIAGATPDLSPEEVRHWLKQFIRENIELKDALQNHNMRMEDQQSRVAAWHEGMNQTNNNLKKQLEEEQKLSQELKDTNETLKQKVQVLEYKNKASEEYHKVECAGWNEELIKLQEQFNCLQSKLQIEQTFQQQFAMSMQGKSSELNDLQSSSKLLEEENRVLTALNNQLKSELSSLKVDEDSEIEEPTVFNDEETGYAIVINPEKAYKYRKVEDTKLKEILLNLKEEQLKVANLNKELAEEKVQVASLKKLLEEQNEKILFQNKHIQASTLPIENSNQDLNDTSVIIVSKEKSDVSTQIPEVKNDATQDQADEDLRKELELTKEKLCLVTSYMQNYKDRCDNLQSQNEEILENFEKRNQNKATEQVVIQLLQQENKELQETLFHEKATHHNQMAHFVEARLCLAQRSAEYNKVVSELESLKSSQNGASSLQGQSFDAKHLEQLDSLTAQLLYSEQQLEEQKLIIQSLNLKIASIQKDSESIPILKAQIEVYKADYESEKKAGEVLATKLRDLQELTENITEEHLTPQKYHHSEFSSSANITSSSPGSSKKIKKLRSITSPKKLSKVQETKLSCPRCMLMFTKFDALQNHVDLCIEDTSFV